MFTSEARKIARENLRLARESGDAETVTRALAEYSRICDREERTRGRRRRERTKRIEATPVEAPIDLSAEFVFEPPPPAVLTPNPPVVHVTDAAATPAAQLFGIPESETIIRKTGGYPWEPDGSSCGGIFNPFSAEQCVASHEYQVGVGWVEEVMRAEEAERAAAFRDYAEKVLGR